MTDQQKEKLGKIKKNKEASQRIHNELDPRFDMWYGLSRNYRKLASRHASATNARDRDGARDVITEMQRVFGEDLFVPWTYTTIETILPRILATDPKIKAKPNDEEQATLEAIKPVERLFERDQARMDYELRLQETVRSGLRYGIGVQKLYWERKYRKGHDIVPYQSKDGYKVEPKDQILVYEGPMVEQVDIRDFFWDPIARDLASCGYLIHRTWRSLDYIADRVKEGEERRSRGEDGGWAELDLEEIKSLGSSNGRDKTWAGRQEASGLSGYSTEGNDVFEIWEFYDRDSVCTVLGEQLIVQEADNPFLHGDYPFQIYRPTLVEGEFVGIGEAEPIAHLNCELNTMRGQRRDAATLAMSPGFFYERGRLNPKNIRTGAGVFNPVDGPPNELVKQIPFSELPSSGVSEEEALKRDIEMTTGITETVLGSGGGETATGAQLSEQAANRRIKQKVKNLHVGVLRPAAKQMRELYRQHLSAAPAQSFMVENPTTPTGYAQVQVGPEHLNANIEVEPIDGSTEPDNPVQKRTDAVQLVDAIAPFAEELNKTKLLTYILRQFGIDHPEEMLVPAGPKVEQIVEALGQTLKEQGMGDEQIHALLAAAYQKLQQPEQLDTSGAGAPQDPPASQNGSAPEPALQGG
jgi:hypothetical protein